MRILHDPGIRYDDNCDVVGRTHRRRGCQIRLYDVNKTRDRWTSGMKNGCAVPPNFMFDTYSTNLGYRIIDVVWCIFSFVYFICIF